MFCEIFSNETAFINVSEADPLADFIPMKKKKYLPKYLNNLLKTYKIFCIVKVQSFQGATSAN